MIELSLAFFVVALTACTSSPPMDKNLSLNGGLSYSFDDRSPSSEIPFRAPSEQIMTNISKYTSEHHYMGYDILACLSADNSKLKLGGTHHWGGTLELFMDYAGGRMDIGKFKSVGTDGKFTKYFDGGKLILILEQKESVGNLVAYLGQVVDSSGMRSEYLKCYLSSSGLESVRPR